MLEPEFQLSTNGDVLTTNEFGTALLMNLLTLLRFNGASDAPAPASGTGLPPYKLRRVTQYIDDHLADEITLGDLAQVAGLSECYLVRQFKRTTGQSPHQYLIARRIEMAKGLLLKEDLPIIEIAFHIGFKNQSHFTSLFRLHTGTTPRGFRRQKLNEGASHKW